MSGFSLDSLKNIGRAAVERGQAERLLKDNILAGYNPESSEEVKTREELTSQRVTNAEESADRLSAATSAYNESMNDPNRLYLTERTSKTDKALDMTAGILGGVASFAGGVAQNFVSDPDSVRAISGTVEGINEGLKGLRSDRSIQDQRIQSKQLGEYRTQLDRLVQDGSITSGQAEMEMFKQTFKTSTVDTNISLVGQGIGSLLPMIAGGVALKAVGTSLKVAAVSQYGLGVASAFGSTKEQILQELDSIPDSDWSKSEFAQNLMRDFSMSYEDAIEATKAKAVEDGYMSLANLAQAGISGAIDKFVVTKAGGLGSFFRGFISKPFVEAGEELFQSTVQTGIANTEYIEKAGEAGDGRDTTYGMGQGGAEGIIGGLGAGAGGHAMGTTTAVVGATMHVAGAVKDGVVKSRDKAAGTKYEKNAEQRNETIAELEETNPEQAAQAREVFETIDAANSFDFDSDTEGLTENVKEALKDKAITDPSDFADAMLEVMASGEMNAEDKASMMLKIDELQDKTSQTAEKAAELANNKEANPKLRRDAHNAARGLNARTMPEEQLGEVRSQIQEDASTLDTEIDESADPATNQAAAKNIATIISVGDVQGKAAFSLAPLLKQVDLHGAEALGLTDNQVQAMRAVSQMLESNPAYVEALRTAQNDSEGGKKNRTSFSVLFGDNEYQKGMNGATYIASIYTNLAKGNVDGAKALLTRLENFAKNQANKAAALEKAIQTGKSQEYEAYSYESGKPVKTKSTVSFGSNRAKTREDKERQTQSLLNTVRSEGNILQSIFDSLTGIIESDGDSFSANNELRDIQTELDQGSRGTQNAAPRRANLDEPASSLAPLDIYDNEAESVNDAPVLEDRGGSQPQTNTAPSPQAAPAAPMESASSDYNTSTAEDGSTIVRVPNSTRVYTISPDGDSLSVRSGTSGRVVNIDINNPQPAVAGFVNKLKQDGLLNAESESSTQEPQTVPFAEFKGEYDYTENSNGSVTVTVEGQQRVYTFSPDGKTLTVKGTVSGNTKRYVTSNAPKSMQGLIYKLTTDGIIDPSSAPTNVKKKSVEGQTSQNKQGSTSEPEESSKQDYEDNKKELRMVEKRLSQLKKLHKTIAQVLTERGGLNRASMEAEGMDPASFRHRGNVFGRHMFPAKGGLLLSDVVEMLNETGYKGGNITPSEALDLIEELISGADLYFDQDIDAEVNELTDNIENLQRAIDEYETRPDIEQATPAPAQAPQASTTQAEFNGTYDFVDNPDGTTTVTVEGQTREYIFSADGKAVTVKGAVSGNTKTFSTTNAPKGMQSLIDKLIKDDIINPNKAPIEVNQDSTSEAEVAPTIQEVFPGINPDGKFAKWNKVIKKSLASVMATVHDIESHISNAIKTQSDSVKETYSHLFRPTTLNNHKPMYSQIRDGLNKIISELDISPYIKKLKAESQSRSGYVDPTDIDEIQKARILEFASYDPETDTWTLDGKVSSIAALTAIDTILNYQEHTESGFDRDDNIYNSPIFNIEQSLIPPEEKATVSEDSEKDKNSEESDTENTPVDLYEDLAARLFSVKVGGKNKYPAEILMNGLTLNQLENAISAALRTMLGVSPNRDGSVFEANTSIQTLALGVINSMMDNGYIKVLQIDGNDVGIKNRKLNVFYVDPSTKEFLAKASKEGGINRTIIKQAFTGKTESGITFDQSELDVNTKVNNSNLNLGEDAQKAIEQAQKTKHYLDTGVFDLFKNMSKAGLLYLFGGNAEGNTFYDPISATLAGRDVTVSNAWQAALDIVETLKGKAAELGETNLSKLPMFYKFGMSVVSRLSPIGAYNPVSDTTMRELIVATKGDVSLSKHGTYLKLAFAQGLDIGIEKKTIGQTVGTDPNTINGDLANLLNKLPKSIAIMRSYLSNPRELTPAEITDLRQEMVANRLPLKPRTTKTLYEFAKYLDAIERGVDTYDSSIYIEADGISNGYVMANAMYAANLNDKTWLEVMERGGITLGQIGKAYADFLGKEGSFDNYKGIANATSEVMKRVDKFYKEFPVTSDYQNHLLNKAITRKDATIELIGMLLGDIEIIDGEVVIQRGQVKDPATKTNYGAANKSMSRSVAKAITDKMAESINEAYRIMAQGMYHSFDDALAAAFFPKEASLQDSKNKFSLLRVYLEGSEDGLLNGFNSLVYPKDEDKEPFVSDTKVKDGNSVVRFNINFNAKARTVIEPQAFEHLAANVERAFIRAVSEGQGVYNPVLSETMENLKVTTGAVSSALVGIYNDLIRKKLKALGIDPNQKLTRGMVTPYLSYKQLSDIIDKDMAKFHPYIEINGTQYPLFKNKQDTVKVPIESTNPDGSVTVEMVAKDNGKDHKDKNPLVAGAPMISSPTYMGVSALANLTISQGDGASVIAMLLNEKTQNLNTGAVYVYDGILYHPSDISAGSQISNQGVKTAIEKGAFTTIVNSLVKSMEAILEYDFDSIAPDIRTKIEKEMRVDVMWGETISERLALIQAAHLEAMQDRALEQDRVMEAVQEIDSSWDQMASVAEPASSPSPNDFETNSKEETLEALRNMVQEGIDERASRDPSKPLPRFAVKPELAGITPEEGSVRSITNKDLKKLHLKMTNRPMKQLFWSMVRSGAIGGADSEVSIKIGNVESLRKELSKDITEVLTKNNPEMTRRELRRTVNEYVNYAFSDGANGFYVPDTGITYIVNLSEEVLVHELIHKAISSKLQAYLNGDIKPGSSDYEAMQNIEKLYERFNHIIESASDESTNYMGIELSFGVRNYLLQKRQTEKRLLTKSVSETDAKFIQLNEFIAWGLSDPDMRAMLEQSSTQGTGITKFHQLRKIASDILDNVLSMIFGERAGTIKQLLRKQDNFLGALELNTQMLFTDTGIERQRKAQASMNVLHHKVIVDDELSHVYEPLVRAWKNIERNPSFVAATDADSDLNKLRPNDVKALEMSKAIMLAESVTNKVASAGFLTDPKEIEAFRHISKFLALGKEVDGLAMQAAQRVFEKVIEKLEITDFLPENPTQHDYDVAQLKYNTLLGSGVEGVTANDQSPILNNFFALTLVNEEFRNLVDKLGVVEQQKIAKDQGVDSAIGSFGNTMIDKITNGLLKTDLSDSASLQIINLFNNITTTPEGAVAGGVQAASSFFEQVMNVADDYVASSVEKTLDAVGSLPKMQVFKVLASTIKNDAAADALADDMLNTASQWKMPQFLKEFIWDIGGRTQTNKNVYDMMKQVRSYIQRRRQLLLENLPEILKNKVPDATQKQLENFTSTMMGLDVGSLLFSEWKSAVLDVNDRQRMIDSLYNQLNHYDVESLSRIADLARFIADKHSMPVGNSINAHNIVISRDGFTDSVYRREMDIVNRLATLEAMDILPQDEVAAILKVNEEGMKFLHGALRAKTQGEMNSLTDNYETFKTKNDLGYIKGNVPAHRDGNEHFINVANNDTAIKRAEERGYTLMEKVGATAVMFSNSPQKAPFSQGIGQNAVQHIGNMRINNPVAMGSDYIFVGNSQHPVSATSVNALVREKDITKLLGVSQSRREEEVRGTMINRELVKNLKNMYANRGNTKDSYINILDPRELKKNPLLKDAVNILGKEIKDEAKLQFGRDNVLMVRKDLLNQVVGYRGGSVADFWNGTNRLPPQVNAAVSAFAEGIMGKDAMSKLLKIQAIHENLVADAKSLIVAKSFIVSAVNAISNAYHLMSLGVPVSDIVSKTPRKVAEIETYVKGTLREIEVETALVSATSASERQKYRAELQSIKDSYKSLSIWPLIERGEFSTVTKDTIAREDLLLTQGKFTNYMESKMSKWPTWGKELGSNVVITKNSPVYEGLQKFVDYGDFVAKALMYDHLTINQKMSKEKALGDITEEFINYDLLPGRFRGTMERLGLMWFYNFKIRSTKIAVRRLRKNPVRSLLVANMPHIDVFGSIGVPVNDNIFYKAADGSLLYSVGPGMGINSPFMHPAVNALDSLFN